ADGFLRAVERLRRGEPATLTAHPRLPSGAAGMREYVYEFELNASPQRLWPYISNTDRLNRAAGLPTVQFVFRPDPQLGTRRFAVAHVMGLRIEWEEHPFEWIEGRRMGVLRQFSRGPFVWLVSVTELLARPGGGTTLRHIVRVEPRGWLGRLAA